MKRFFSNSPVNGPIFRFAPSPTGSLHLGGLRTALHNFIQSRKEKGTFLIRIEDTDTARNQKGSAQNIIDTLKKFKIKSDLPIIYQSRRLNLYRERAQWLVDNGYAYLCWCMPPPEMLKRNKSTKCIGCKYLSVQEASAKAEKQSDFVIRHRLPDNLEAIVVTDALRGDIAFSTSNLTESVLLRSNGQPTYHLASVVDDIEAGVTDIIRGVEWLPSTAKHILLFNALCGETPRVSHCAPILDKFGLRLSKRADSTSINTLLEQGYLPSAILNYVLLLGWAPIGDRNIFDIETMVEKFDIERIKHSPTKLNIKTLRQIQSAHLKHFLEKGDKHILEIMRKEFENVGVFIRAPLLPKFERVLNLLTTKCSLPPEFAKAGKHFFVSLPGRRIGRKGEYLYVIRDAVFALEDCEEWTVPALKEILKSIFEQSKARNEMVNSIKFLREVITGTDFGPELADTMFILGREKVLQRLSATNL